MGPQGRANYWTDAPGLAQHTRAALGPRGAPFCSFSPSWLPQMRVDRHGVAVGVCCEGGGGALSLLGIYHRAGPQSAPRCSGPRTRNTVPPLTRDIPRFPQRLWVLFCSGGIQHAEGTAHPPPGWAPFVHSFTRHVPASMEGSEGRGDRTGWSCPWAHFTCIQTPAALSLAGGFRST